MQTRGFSRSRFVRAGVAVFVLLLLAIWNPAPVSSALRATFHTVLWPFEKVFSGAAFQMRSFADLISSIGELHQENESLSEENIRLKAENAGLEFLRSENENLRKSAGFEARKKFDLVAAEVIVSGGEGERGSVVIDRGSSHGLRNGMPVIVGDGVLVGVIDETYPASAKVTLVSSSQSSLGGVTVEGGSQGILRGQRGLGIAFGMVLQTDPVHVGDRVVTSGIGGGIPSGLFVGTIDRVQDSGDRLSREATVVSPIDFSRLRFLFCIRSEQSS